MLGEESSSEFREARVSNAESTEEQHAMLPKPILHQLDVEVKNVAVLARMNDQAERIIRR
jgi:hypothetical protein